MIAGSTVLPIATAAAAARPSHRWRFFRAGGLDQARIETADDLRNLDQLDPKLWVALACPVGGLELDERTLRLIDGDGDGRVRLPEVVAAVRWICGLLRDPAAILRPGPALPLDLIDDRGDEGRRILAAARRILADRGRGDAGALGVDDASDTVRTLADGLRNGDGIIPPAAVEAGPRRQLIADAVACLGGAADRSGQSGLDAAGLEAFLAACAAHAAWFERGAGLVRPGLPDVAAVAAAAAAVQAIRGKVDDWFARGRAAAFDERARAAANHADYPALLAAPLDARASALAALPLAAVGAEAALDLDGPINPAWAAAAADLRTAAALPALGRARLDAADWAALTAVADAWVAWQAAMEGAAVARLGIERVRAILADAATAAEVRALIAADAAMRDEVDALGAAERLARYYRDLGTLLRNFVNFAEFYDPQQPAVFQAGSLYLDQRRFDLAVKVADPGAHAKLAGLGRCFLLYCRCTRHGETPIHIVAAATQGDADELRVGRNGLWIDRGGRDWDAAVIAVVEAPVSIREAFWSPYKKLGRLIEEQVVKRIGSAGGAVDAKLSDTATAVAAIGQAPPKPPEPAGPRKIDVGTVAAIGVAMGAIGTLVGTIFGKMIDLGWYLPLGLAGLILAISGPSMLIAAIKLRGRSLGPILEANGWAIGGRVRINIPLGTLLTAPKQLPPGAVRSLIDPFADESAARWRRRILIAVVLILLAVAAWLILGRLGSAAQSGPALY